MKVGILTFHDANNYGAALQAYGLQEAIKSLEIDVEIINYVQPYIVNKYRTIRIDNSNLKKFFKSVLSTVLHYKNFSMKEKEFNQFRNEFLKISNTKYNDMTTIKGYDIFVAGSDQIWNFKITNYDTAFFLDFVDSSSLKVSYAASIGDVVLNDNDKMFIKNYISNFDYISIREESGIQALQELTKKELVHVLDPTFLLDKDKWGNICLNKYNGKEYIFVYSVSASNKIIQIVNKISQILDLEVYLLTDKLNVKVKNHKRCYGIGPIEFIDLVKNAKFVISDSFHGTAFSIIFEKNFISVSNEVGGTRIKDLLERLNLSNRVIKNLDEINQQYEFEINYIIVNEILKLEKNKSVNFLKECILDINKDKREKNE